MCFNNDEYRYTFKLGHFFSFIVIFSSFFNIYSSDNNNNKQYIKSQKVEIYNVKNNLSFKNNILENENFIDKLLFFLKKNTSQILDDIYVDESFKNNVLKNILKYKNNYLENKKNKNIPTNDKKINNLKIYNEYKKNIELLKKKYLRFKIFKDIKLKKKLYNREKIIEINKNINTYFENLGYLNNEVNTEVIFNKNNIYINHKINEGDIFYINSFEILSNNLDIKNIIEKNIKKFFRKKNEKFLMKKIENFQNKCYKDILCNGYFNFKKELIKIYICKNNNEKNVDIIIAIESNKNDLLKKYKYEDFIIEYECDYEVTNRERNNILYKISNPVKKYTINKLFKLKKGNYYNEKDIENLYNSLFFTDIFKYIDIKGIIKNDLLYISTKLIPVERFSLEYSIKLNINRKNIHIINSSSVKIKNYFKRMEQFLIQLIIENKNKYILKDFKYLDNYSFSFSNNISYPYSIIFDKYCDKTNINIGFINSFDKKKNIFTKLNYILKYKYINIDINISFLDITIDKIKIYNKLRNQFTQDSALSLKLKFKNNYIISNFTIEWHISSINKYFNLIYKSIFFKYLNNNFNYFIKLLYDQIFIININNNFNIKFFIKTGNIFYLNKKIPENTLFKLGGEETLRGWNYGEVGPGLTKNKGNGTFLLYFSNEYNLKINNDLFFVPFIDCGNIWNNKDKNKKNIEETFTINKNIIKHFYLNTGFGFEFLIGVFKIRSDIGIKIYEPQSFKDIFNITFRVINN